jgi:hypothetical protein
MQYDIKAVDIKNNLQNRIDELQAELAALNGVNVNIKHKKLTNKAISGNGARIANYGGIDKALYLSYSVKYKNGHSKYEHTSYIVYSYNDEKGDELGSDSCLRISRTITPVELVELLSDIITARLESLTGLELEYKKADSIAKKHNKIVKLINEYNEDLSYASKARF